MKRFKIKEILFGLLFVFVATTAIFLTSCKREEKVIKIGAILPLTGNLGFIGEMAQKSFQLALEKEKLDKKVKIIYFDSRGLPKEGVTGAQKLLSIQDIDIVVSTPSPITSAIFPLVKRAHRVHFVYVFDPDIPSLDTLSFRLFVSSRFEALKFAEWIRQKGYKKVAYLHLNLEVYEKVKNTMSSILPEVTIIDHTFDFSLKNFKNVLSKIKKENVELLIIGAFAPYVIQIIRDYKALKLDIPCLGGLDFLDVGKYTDRKLISGIPFVGCEYILSKGFEEFTRMYKKKYNETPHYFSPFYYALLQILKEYLSANRYFNTSKFIKFIKSTKFDFWGLKGYFDEDGNFVTTYIFLTYDNYGKAQRIFP